MGPIRTGGSAPVEVCALGIESASFKSIAFSPELRELLMRAFDSTIPYEEFVELPMPEGCDPQDMWDFVMTVMHCSGETRNLRAWRKGVEKNVCWSYETKDIRRDLFHIASLANPDSPLNSVLPSVRNEDRLLSYIWEEMAHCARFDGIYVPERLVSEIWKGRKKPVNDGQRVIANAAKVFTHASRLAGAAPYSRMLIAEIQELLVEGTSGGDGFVPSYHWDPDIIKTELTESPVYANQLLDFEMQLTKDIVDVQDVVKTAAFAGTALRDVAYVPMFRNLTELLLRAVFFSKKKTAILAYVPASSIYDNRMGESKRNYILDSARCADEGLFTNWLHWGMVKAYREGIDAIAETIDDLEQDARVRKAAISKIPSLTLRQRSFLGLAASHPTRWFKVKEYADYYDVAYATARKDLNELTSRGYLAMRKIGRAYCYQSVPTSRV